MLGILCHPFTRELNGLELSELQRYFMFNNRGVNQKFISMDFDEEAVNNFIYHGIEKDDVINMWDYFQDTTPDMPILSGHPTAFEIGFDRDVYIVPKMEYHML